MVNVKNIVNVRKINKIAYNVLEKKEMVNVYTVTRHIMFQMERNVLKLKRFHVQQVKTIVKHVIQMDMKVVLNVIVVICQEMENVKKETIIQIHQISLLF